MITEINIFKLFEAYNYNLKLIEEGLIKTHDINKSLDVLLNYVTDKDISIINSEIHKNRIIIEYGSMSLSFFLQNLTLITNLGYFITKVRVSINEYKYTYSWNNFKEILDENLFKKLTKIELRLEAVFDNVIEINTNKIYHVTYNYLVDKILKIGLIPKSNNVMQYHPDRLYLVQSIEDAQTYINSKNNYFIFYPDKDKKINIKQQEYNLSQLEYTILEIDITNLNLKFYQDTNYNKGFYTLNTIPPTNIKIYND